MTFTPIPYDEWAADNPELCQPAVCEYCKGEGIIKGGEHCQCPDCGDYHITEDRDCGPCEGTGEMPGDGPKLYAEQVKRDREKWEREVGA